MYKCPDPRCKEVRMVFVGLSATGRFTAKRSEASEREQRRSEAVDSGEATGLILTYVPYITTAVLHGTCLRYTVVASSAAWYLYN